MLSNHLLRRALIGALLLMNPSPLWPQTARTEEYRLKAAFVYRFPQFVEWPPSALKDRDTLQICVSQPDPFVGALQDLVSGESLNGRPIVVRVLESPNVLDGCQILFVSDRTRTPVKTWLNEASSQPVLTIGDSADFLDDGGIIALRVIDRRVRFEIDVAAANRAKLQLSSQLLRLAINVRGATE